VTLGTLSASGTCFYIKDVATGSSAGTFYAKDPACDKPSTAAPLVTGASW
jgi:hypothetical protein